MTYQPYVPTHRQGIADEDAVARMHAKLRGKLALAAKSAENPQKDAFNSAEVPVSRPPLEWLDPEPGQTGYYDSTKRYSVCWVVIAGHTLYEAWKFQPGSGWFCQVAVGLKSEAIARAAAQADSERRSGDP